jgi:nucleoside-diphosphate-sugar epimerase
MSKVLITGANGYIAHHLKKIIQQPYLSLDMLAGADYQICISEVQHYQNELDDIEIVFHLADQKLQDLNDSNIEANILRHHKFIQSMERLPSLKAFIFCSSCSVYGATEGIITEDSPTHLTSSYAKSKFETEKLIQQSSLPRRIIRFATAYGLSRPMRYDLIVNDLALSLKDKVTREIYGLDASRPYIHCKDFAQALLGAVQCPQGTLKNIVESNWTKREILNLIQDISKKELPLRINESRLDIRNYCVRPNQILPFKYTFQNGLRELIDAHL